MENTENVENKGAVGTTENITDIPVVNPAVVTPKKKKVKPVLYAKTVDATWGGLADELELAAEVGRHMFTEGLLVITDKKGPNATIVKNVKLK